MRSQAHLVKFIFIFFAGKWCLWTILLNFRNTRIVACGEMLPLSHRETHTSCGGDTYDFTNDLTGMYRLLCFSPFLRCFPYSRKHSGMHVDALQFLWMKREGIWNASRSICPSSLFSPSFLSSTNVSRQQLLFHAS